MKSQNIELCDKSALTDLRNIRIHTEKALPDRVLEFAEQVKNPYLFKVGDIAVSVIYCGDKSLSDALTGLLKAG